jgi:hypothetical protein
MVRVQQDGLDEGSFLFLELTEILRGDDASGDQTVRLCEQRGLQTIRHEPWSFLLDVDRFAADAVVELDCGCGCCGICSWMRNDFHQRWPMRTRSGFLHWLMNCELGMPEEEEAITTSLRVFASISARSFSFSSGLSGAFCLRVSLMCWECLQCMIMYTPLG